MDWRRRARGAAVKAYAAPRFMDPTRGQTARFIPPSPSAPRRPPHLRPGRKAPRRRRQRGGGGGTWSRPGSSPTKNRPIAAAVVGSGAACPAPGTRHHT
jgi:hypothetical protein